MAVGEAYMDGSLTVDGGDVYPLLDLINRNTFRAGYNPLSRLHHARYRLGPFAWCPVSNSLKTARRNAAYTYDLDAEFYRLFLISTCNTPAAIFRSATMQLDDAQEEMLQLAAKLLLKPEWRCSGWVQVGESSGFLTGLEAVTVDGSPSLANNCGMRSAGTRKGSRQPHSFFPARSSSRAWTVRSHRLGGHVRTCRRAALSALLQEGP